MHREVIWSSLSEKDLENILDYLSKNWNEVCTLLLQRPNRNKIKRSFYRSNSKI